MAAGLGSVTGCSSLTAQQTEGKHLYQDHCAYCHEDNYPNLHGIFKRPSLATGGPATDDQVKQIILNGRIGSNIMPSFSGHLNDEQITALLAYLHTTR